MTPDIIPSWIDSPPSYVLFDTEPLLAFIVGSFDRSRLGTESTKKFMPEDFELLERIALRFRLISTPNMLEHYTTNSELSATTWFIDIGLSDTSIIAAASELNALVIATDGRLLQRLYEKNIPALLYSQIRNYNEAKI
ncbi:MAG TPA: hypothetical protein VGM92_11410 [Candidatus Kapabacteria bacterium]|jgi:hypothetical protein